MCTNKFQYMSALWVEWNDLSVTAWDVKNGWMESNCNHHWFGFIYVRTTTTLHVLNKTPGWFLPVTRGDIIVWSNDYLLVVPEHVDGGLAAAEVTLVDDVIVDQWRRVDHFADHRHLPLRRQQSTVPTNIHHKFLTVDTVYYNESTNYLKLKFPT